MPERWQDELKKLRREEMPDGVRERAEAGPRRELPNDGRQRLVAGLVAFAVFIAAGAFAWRAFDGPGSAGSEPTRLHHLRSLQARSSSTCRVTTTRRPSRSPSKERSRRASGRRTTGAAPARVA